MPWDWSGLTRILARELASTIARRGGRVRGTIEAMRDLAPPEGEGRIREVEFIVRFVLTDGVPRRVTLRQGMNRTKAAGLVSREAVEISYDRDDPDAVLIWGSPKYRFVEGVAVRVVDLRVNLRREATTGIEPV